jgi:hypothetical protein
LRECFDLRTRVHRRPVPEGFVTTADASRILGKPQTTLRAYRTPSLRHYGPPFFVESSERVLYRLDDLKDWLEADGARMRAKADARFAQAAKVAP